MGKWRTWRPSEVQKLRALVGELPMPLVIQRWNTWARRVGLPPRTEASLRRKALELGLSVVPRGAWVSISEVRRLLDRSQSCLYGWVQAGWVQHRPGALHRASLQQLAMDRPHLFAGCPAEGLLELLRDPALAASIRAAHPRARSVPRRPQRVMCVTTGQVFPSMRAAGRRLHLDGSAIGKAVREGREAAGLRFRLVERGSL